VPVLTLPCDAAAELCEAVDCAVHQKLSSDGNRAMFPPWRTVLWEQAGSKEDHANASALAERAAHAVYSSLVLPLLRDFGAMLEAMTPGTSSLRLNAEVALDDSDGPIDRLTLACVRLGCTFDRWHLHACRRVAMDALSQAMVRQQQESKAGHDGVVDEEASWQGKLRLMLLRGGLQHQAAAAVGEHLNQGHASRVSPTLLIAIPPAIHDEAWRKSCRDPVFVLSLRASEDGGFNDELDMVDSWALLDWEQQLQRRAPSGYCNATLEPQGMAIADVAIAEPRASVAAAPERSVDAPRSLLGLTPPSSCSSSSLPGARGQVVPKTCENEEPVREPSTSAVGCFSQAPGQCVMGGAGAAAAAPRGSGVAVSTHALPGNVKGGTALPRPPCASGDAPPNGSGTVAYWATATREVDTAVSIFTAAMIVFVLVKAAAGWGAVGDVRLPFAQQPWLELAANLLPVGVMPVIVMAFSAAATPEVGCAPSAPVHALLRTLPALW
jgi:hypothetical protein